MSEFTTPEFLQDFQDEVEEHLQNVTHHLLALERRDAPEPDEEAVHAVPEGDLLDPADGPVAPDVHGDARSCVATTVSSSTKSPSPSTRSATRASRVENTFSRVAMPDSRKMGVSATWMTWATKSKDEI